VDLKKGDELFTQGSKCVIQSVNVEKEETECFQVEFESAESCVFVAMADALYLAPPPCDMRLEVYGELCPRSEKSNVKILMFKFSNFNKFEKWLLRDDESDKLCKCRCDLENEGYFADLAKHDLGPGKMFVDPWMARFVIHELEEREKRTGRKLTPRDVVVSKEFERVVLEVIHQHTRAKVKSETELHFRTNNLWLRDSTLEWSCLDTKGNEVRCAVKRTFITLTARDDDDKASSKAATAPF